MQHMYYQANPNSTEAPWSGSPANCPAWWGHAVSTFGQPGDLVEWTEVEASAIRGGSGAILPVPEKMHAAVGDGVKAIAFGGAFQPPMSFNSFSLPTRKKVVPTK